MNNSTVFNCKHHIKIKSKFCNIFALNKSLTMQFLISGLFLSIAIDMGGDFGLRNVFFIIFSLPLLKMVGIKFPQGWLIPFSILLVYPIIVLDIGIISGAKISIAISQYQSTALAFAIYILLSKLPYKTSMQIILQAITFVALLAICLAIGLLLGIDSVSGILSHMANKGGGYFGERSIGAQEILPNVYFKATLFFVPTFVIALFTRKYFIALVCFMALVAAISKIGIAITILTTFILALRKENFKSYLISFFILIIAVLSLYQSPFFTLFEEIVKNDSGTVNVRIGHFDSIMKLWGDNLLSLLFGFGLGSTFYSSGAGGIVSNIEIDHFNVVRKYGLFWSSLFFIWVLKVAYTAIKNTRSDVRGLGWGLLLIFIVAGTNPVLISPLFFLFLFLTMTANHQTAKVNNI
jgi:hypothetical protein